MPAALPNLKRYFREKMCMQDSFRSLAVKAIKTGQLKFSIAFSVSSYIRRSFVITSHHRTQDRKQMYVDFVVDTFFYVVLVIILTLFFFHQIRLSILTVPLCQRRFQIKSSTTKIPCYGWCCERSRFHIFLLCFMYCGHFLICKQDDLRS